MHIRDILYHGGPKTVSELRAELNRLRKTLGMSLVTREYVRRLVREAEGQGLVSKVASRSRASSHPIEGHPELDSAHAYKLVTAKLSSPKWVRLTFLVKGLR